MAYVRALLDGKSEVTVIESRPHEGKKGHVVNLSSGYQWFPSERVRIVSINGIRIPERVIKYSAAIEYPLTAIFSEVGKKAEERNLTIEKVYL